MTGKPACATAVFGGPQAGRITQAQPALLAVFLTCARSLRRDQSLKGRLARIVTRGSHPEVGHGQH